MKTISQREFRNGSAAVMDAVEKGETFRVTRHGVEIAELGPVGVGSVVGIPELKKQFGNLPAGGYTRMRAEADDVFGADRIDD